MITAIRHQMAFYLPTLQDMGYTLNVPKEIRQSEAFHNGVEQTRPREAQFQRLDTC